MSDKLTDLSGIGDKTAEKLRTSGFEKPRDLADARRRGDPRLNEFSSRVQDASREAATSEFGEFNDRFSGVRLTEENRSQVEALESREVSDLNDSGSVTRYNSSLQGDSLLDLGRKAIEGAGLAESLGAPKSQEELRGDPEKREKKQPKFNIAQMGFDAAAGIANVGRDTIEEANKLRQEAQSPGTKGSKTAFTQTNERESFDGSTTTYEKDVRINPREFAAAKRVHNARSPMAKRVDSRREAQKVTGDFETWVNNPSQVDYPGVDTPQKGAAAGRGLSFGDGGNEQMFEADVARKGGFTLKEKSEDNDARDGRVQQKAGKILSQDQDTQALVLGDLLPDMDKLDDIGVEPKGPDKELFGGDQKGGFL